MSSFTVSVVLCVELFLNILKWIIFFFFMFCVPTASGPRYTVLYRKVIVHTILHRKVIVYTVTYGKVRVRKEKRNNVNCNMT